MNNKERENFWKILCSLSGEDVSQDFKKIQEVIKYPKYLYRYRYVSTNTLEALRTNKLYFSSANYYDAPFDTFLQIDLNAIKENIIKELDDVEATFNKFEKIKNILKFKNIELSNTQLNELTSLDLINKFLNHIGELRNLIKGDIWSVCFSEDGFNETLWLKYADEHKGFAVMYDFYDDEKFLCGKTDACKDCQNSNVNTSLYSIYYSDEKYDATKLAINILIKDLETQNFNNGDLSSFYLPAEKLNWERERVTLIKKKCHEYDKEWRLTSVSNIQIIKKWVPCGIMLGLNMSNNEQNLVTSIAKQIGIEKIYKCYIDDKGDLNAYLIK